jgi:nucleoside phosphorylase
MLVIAAALSQELETALGLCTRCEKMSHKQIRAWTATRNENNICFLKTGIGPKRSGGALRRLLSTFNPSQVLVIGYAGALNPSLLVADLVVVKRAILLDPKVNLSLSESPVAGEWDLAQSEELCDLCAAQGLRVNLGNVLTSAHIVGEPTLRRTLHQKFGAEIVDMETAALARESAAAGIPMRCVRAISDTAQDTFLDPFSHDPSAGPMLKTKKILAAGNWIRRYDEWRTRSAAARESLSRFLIRYLDSDQF